jgi:AcrR family transcriptional regulator
MAVAPRRTQEQRTAQTRAKLLDATVESLLATGYAATTTRRVAELAGVSQGAQTHHFPYRVDLVTAAVQRMAEQRVADIERRLPELPQAPRERISALLDLLWDDYASDLFTVFVKVWVAAADDPELHDRLVPIERELSRTIARLADRLLEDVEVGDDMDARMSTVLATMRGLALSHRFEPRAERPRDLWSSVRPVLGEVLLAGFPD